MIFKLGLFPGATGSEAYDINDSGIAVGRVFQPGGLQAAWWLSASAPPFLLGHLGGGISQAYSINMGGMIVGSSSTVPEFHAFVSNGGPMTDLGLPGAFSEAVDLNSIGQIVGGNHPIGSTDGHAFLFQSGTMTDLGTLGGYLSRADGINDMGQIIGGSAISKVTGEWHAFLMQAGGAMTDIGSPMTNSHAYDINNSGDIVGDVMVGGLWRAFVLQGGTLTVLGTLGGLTSHARAINDIGQVVGWSTLGPPSFKRRAFLFDSGTMYDLGALTPAGNSVALGCNNIGQIVGWSDNGIPADPSHEAVCWI